jgi:hypothetical protein
MIYVSFFRWSFHYINFQKDLLFFCSLLQYLVLHMSYFLARFYFYGAEKKEGFQEQECTFNNNSSVTLLLFPRDLTF